jgi:hypothetical protein
MPFLRRDRRVAALGQYAQCETNPILSAGEGKRRERMSSLNVRSETSLDVVLEGGEQV